MGDLNVDCYSYTPGEMHDNATIGADLQTKLRALTGGGSGDPSKIHHFEVRMILGMVHVFVISEN